MLSLEGVNKVNIDKAKRIEFSYSDFDNKRYVVIDIKYNNKVISKQEIKKIELEFNS